MKLSDLGEFGLIAAIKEQFSDFSSIKGVEGIGDDCAIVPKDEHSSYVITTDMLVEGKHFLVDKIAPFELGYKSLSVNISDVAAMGAIPKFSLLSLAVSKNLSAQWCQAFIEGYHSLSVQHNILLIGGDTTAADIGHTTLSITAIGEVENKNIKRRSSAKSGDIIAVNTFLGDSALALQLMLQGEPVEEALMKKHNMPAPQVKEGIWFGTQKGVHAMMDISDGVASDIEHICSLSGCGAEIDTDRIPHSAIFSRLCLERGIDPLSLSLAGGEDYGLLMTIDKDEFVNIQDHYDGTIYPIGKITQSGKTEYIERNGEKTVQKLGFRHF